MKLYKKLKRKQICVQIVVNNFKIMKRLTQKNNIKHQQNLDCISFELNIKYVIFEKAQLGATG